jgi:hypothetical protein
MKNKIFNNKQEMRQQNFDSSRNVIYICMEEISAKRKLFAGMYVAIIYVTIGATGGSCRAATSPPYSQSEI